MSDEPDDKEGRKYRQWRADLERDRLIAMEAARERAEREAVLRAREKRLTAREQESAVARELASESRFMVSRALEELGKLNQKVAELSTAQPPAAEPATEQLDQLREQMAQLQEQVNGLRAENQLQKQGEFRRGFSYSLYGVGAALPVAVLGYLAYCVIHELSARHAALADAAAAKTAVASMVLGWPEIWFFYGLPVLATAVTSGTLFAIAGKLMLSPLVAEQIAITEANRPQAKDNDVKKLVTSTIEATGEAFKKFKE